MGQAPLAPTISPERAGYVAYMIVPPDGGYGWVIIFITFLGCVILDGMTFSFSIFRNPIAESLSVDSTEVAVLSSGFTGIYFIGGIVSCAIANRYGFRVVMIMGSIIVVICFTITGVLNYIYQMYIIYGLIGGMGAGLLSIALVLPPGFYFDKKRPIAMGLSSSGTGVGAICLPPIMEYCVNEYGWRNTFFIQGGILSILIFLGCFLRPLQPVQVNMRVNENITDAESIKETFMFSTFPDVFSTRSLAGRSMLLDSVSEYPTITDIAETTRGSVTLENAPHGLISRLQQLTAPRTIPSSTRSAQIPVQGKTSLVEIQSTPKLPLRKRLFRKQDTVGARPLYRSDVLYHGSLMRLSEYKEKETDIEYHMEVTRPATRRDILEETEKICLVCPEAIWRGLKTLFNFKLLKSPTFLCLSTCAFFNYISFYIPFLYIGERAKHNGLGEYDTLLISIIGVGLAVGRILSGIVVTLFPTFSALACIIITCSIAGLSAIATTYYNHVAYQIMCMALYGFNVGVFAPLRSIVIVDFMGLDQLTTASGMIIFIQGIGSLLGPPVAERAKHNGLGEYDTLLISIIGVGLAVGRILSGIVVTLFPTFSALACIIITCSIAGLSAIATTYYNHVAYQIMCMALYGFNVGVFAPLRSIVIVDFMGLDQLTTASGMIIFIQGIGSLLGPPVADYLKNKLLDPNAPFYLTGGFLLLSSIVLMPMKLINKWEVKRQRFLSSEI